MQRGVVALAATLALMVGTGAEAQEGPPIRTVIEGTEFVTGIAFTSDGRMVFNQRAGRVRIVQDGELRGEPLAEIPTTTSGEAGLLGIAVPPDTSQDPAVYVFATAPDGGSNRVLRVPLDLSEPSVVVDGLTAGTYHNGGGLAFASDGSLLVSNGESHDSDRAQDPTAPGGKVYRFTPRGEVPPDNPFDASPAYAIGLRNPYGLTVDPVSGEAFVTENGPDSNDEINRVVAGGNYGWPEVSGNAPDGEAIGSLAGTYHDPLITYEDVVVPTGIAVADPATSRPEFAGDLFFATYGEGTIRRVVLDEERAGVVSEEVFVDLGEPVVALAWGPGGLYFSTEEAIRLVALGRDAGEPAPVITATPEGDEGPLGGRNPAIVIVFTAIVVAVLYATRRRLLR